MKSEVVLTDQELPSEVVKAIKQGRKVVAIKLLCDTTGIGMANAKVLVDRASVRLNPQPPRQTFMKDYNPTNMRLVSMAFLLAAAVFAYRYFAGS